MTADPAYYLSIYIHAHKTGNSVPPHIEAEAIAALKDRTSESATMSGFLATKEAVEEYLHDTSAQPESTERPIWTEGVCGDGAAILKDGVMQPIEDVIAALNAAEPSQPEPPADWEVAKLARLLREEVRELRESGSVGHLTRDERLRVADLLEQLTQPELVGPTELTDDELLRCFKIGTPCYDKKAWQRELDGARAAIAADRARHGRFTIAPIPVSERPWEREGFCDTEGKCWWWDDDDEKWCLHDCSIYILGWTHCLPFYALLTPAAPETA